MYRVLLWCYPRRFHCVYREDLVQAFRDELRDRGTLRGWWRVLADLVVSVPRQNVEAAMTQRTSFSALTRLVIAGAAALAMFAFGGMFALAALVIIAAATFGYWRGRIPYREALHDGSSSWWRYLLAGAALLGGIALATNYGPDFDWFPWAALVMLFLLGWGLLGLGVLLGIASLGQSIRRRTRAAEAS
jgi:hypothetical protein